MEVRVWSLLLAVALAQAPEASAPRAEAEPLVVAIKSSPPFTYQDRRGRWTGLSHDLWAAIAEETGRTYQLREMTLPEMLDGLQSGQVDVGVAALTVTAEREQAFDFTHPFFQGGLGIAVDARRDDAGYGLLDIVGLAFVQVIGLLLLVLSASAFVIWWFERRGASDDPRRIVSLFDAFWFSAVTMTTVGYGDRIPQTTPGRVAAMVWMLSSVVLVSSFTAAITSSLTVQRFQAAIEGPEDLDNATVGIVEETSSARWVMGEKLRHELYPTPGAALEGLALREVDAVVYDAPVLQHLARRDHNKRIAVLPRTFHPESYAIGMREGLPGQDRLDQALLERLESEWWAQQMRRYHLDE